MRLLSIQSICDVRGDTEPMKRSLPVPCFVALLHFALLSTLSACGGAGGRVVWPAVAQCSGDGVSNALPAVSTILATDGGPELLRLSADGKRQISQLAIKFGVDVIACGIQRLVGDWSAPPTGATGDGIPPAEHDPQIRAAAERGRAFLEEVGTKTTLDVELSSGSE
jgi:hypothetical protein